MSTEILTRKFAAMGARVKLAPSSGRWSPPFTLDVRSDRRGEYFDLHAREDEVHWEVVDVRPEDRHLLLMTRDETGKHKFLCGHDERHWFVAAVPEKARGVTGVRTAMEALKPEEVLEAQARRALRIRARQKRRNAAFVRQGEWFFLPARDVEIDPTGIRRNEPLSRGRGSKPHIAEECWRTRGETVYVNGRFPGGITEEERAELLRVHPRLKKASWTVMTRNAHVYVRGTVRHADHRTVRLFGWHRVVMNTENRSQARAHVVFLD